MLYCRIKDMRDDGDKTQMQLAKYLGVARSTYASYESGERAIPAEHIVRLAQFYNTSTDYVFGLTDENKPYPKTKRPTL